MEDYTRDRTISCGPYRDSDLDENPDDTDVIMALLRPSEEDVEAQVQALVKALQTDPASVFVARA